LRLSDALATLDIRLLEAQSSNLSALEVIADLLEAKTRFACLRTLISFRGVAEF
jgi:hypothetical protein